MMVRLLVVIAGAAYVAAGQSEVPVVASPVVKRAYLGNPDAKRFT